MTRIVGACLFAAFLLGAGSTIPAPAAATTPTMLTIGYIDLAHDARYRVDNAYAGIVYRTLGRPWPGAELGIKDAAMIGRVIGVKFTLERKTASAPDKIDAAAEALAKDGAHFIITDLPASDLVKLADALKGQPVLLMNVSARDDSLRGADCRANVAHVIPSESMLTDALVQYLVARNWTHVLVLEGPAPADKREVAAFERSAGKFGATVEDVRPFVLGEDPRHRDENNVALLTAGADPDVIFVADSGGEEGRYVPYETSKPTPVVGDAGLQALAWHWAWYRYGAPQVQQRFEKLAMPRRMNGNAWAAWVAVKAVTTAAMRSDPKNFEAMRKFMLGPKIDIDGSKGRPMSFRPWNHQLRQQILLATPDAVIADAPLPQYLHETNVLDTLGTDAPQAKCHF